MTSALFSLPRVNGDRIASMAISVLLAGAVVGLILLHASDALPAAQWWDATWRPDPQDMRQIIFHDSVLPRLCVSVLVGLSLGAAGAVMQDVLRNPLAEPGTTGVSAGAHLAVVIATLWRPEAADGAREVIAFFGALAATALVVTLAARNRGSPTILIVAGLLVALQCGAFGSVFALFHFERLSGVFIWGSGSLVQNDWAAVERMFAPLVVAGGLVALLARPLAVAGLGDDVSRSLGLSPAFVRFTGLGLAALLASLSVSAVGVIAFVGLAAPALARSAGARTFTARLTFGALIGAGLLTFTDQAVQWLQPLIGNVQAGAATALLGAPLLVAMTWRRLPVHPLRAEHVVTMRMRRVAPAACLLVIALVFVVVLALTVGQGPDGWRVDMGEALQSLSPWRAPRIAAAAAGGALLATAGVLMQRMTANPMASPEVLGVSSGAALGVIMSLLFFPALDRPGGLLAGGVGALIALAVLLSVSRSRGFTQERLILTGVAFATASSAIVALLIALGDPRLPGLLTWMAGSTYRVTAGEAATAVATAVLCVASAPLLARWLDILPLGAASARGLGVSLLSARIVILLATSLATATATLVIGPLSFVGVMAPHMVRLMGVNRAAQQVFLSALLGALVMALADWLGRNLLFPRQIPAGLIASLVAGPYLIRLLWRRPISG